MTRYDWPAPPRGGDDPAGRAGHLQQFRPRVDPLTIAPPKRRASRRRAVPHNKPAGNQNLWFPIGPTTMTNGQAGGNPNVAGRIRDLQVEPTAGLRVYAASAGGGVWFSENRGDTWRPLDEWQTSDRGQGNIASALSCGAIHVIWGSSVDGSDDVVWVGTGEPSLTTNGQVAIAGAQPGGSPIGSSVAGIGFLNRDPAVAGGAWTIVKGDPLTTDPDTLRGAAFFRIVADPDPAHQDQLIAATTNGLYLKPPGAGWTKQASFVPSVQVQPMDVVVTRLAAGLRIWVASASSVMVAEIAQGSPAPINPAAALVFTSVALPGVYTETLTGGTVVGTCLQLATDGSKIYVLGRGVLTGDRATPPAAVWTIDATAAITPGAAAGAPSGISATALKGTPPDLFMSASDQSAYDMCVEAQPTVPGRIYIGGATVGTSTGWNGAIYRCETTATQVKPTMIGEGTHADVHVLRSGPSAPGQPTKRTVWTGTDGGMFRSDSDGDPGTFVSRNDGVAVLQPGFVANHPSNPGIVVAGFQDNGTAVRTGDGVWRQTFVGDGGGVAYDPVSTNRYFRQYTAASWDSSDNGAIAPIERRNARQVGKIKTSEALEAESSLFYSGCDAVTHGGDTHLVLGSDRVWYSRDWGRSWVTLPTATDPRGGDNPDVFQDVLETAGAGLNYVDKVGSTDCCSTTSAGKGTKGSGIVTVRASVAPNDAGGNLVLRVLALYPSGLVWFIGTRAPAAAGPFTWTPLAGVPRQLIKYPIAASADETAFQNGQPLTFLPAPQVVSDVFVQDPARGTLGSCYVTTTGFPYSRPGGPTIPLDTLWFFDGTNQWIPTGLSITHPNGTWAVAADRITAPALGVVVDPGNRTTVYVATSVGVVKGELTIGGTPAAPTYAWAWSQFMNGLPEAAVQDLSIFSGSGLKLLRAATQSRGVWEVDLANPVSPPLSYLRLFHTDTRRVLPTPTSGDLLNGDPTNPVHWDDSPDVVIDASDTAYTSPLSETQLDTVPKPGPATGAARVSTNERHVKVHVLAHHRVPDITIPANQIKIALFRHALPDNGIVPISQLWAALVAAAPGTVEPAPLPDGWMWASAQHWQSPGGPVDPRLPRALTFDVDLSSDATGTALVFLAVVMNTSNQIGSTDLALGGVNQAQTADQLVVASPHVAAKSVVLT